LLPTKTGAPTDAVVGLIAAILLPDAAAAGMLA
jgi:hypothetical protein